MSKSKSRIIIGIAGLILGNCATISPNHSDFEVGMSRDEIDREFGNPILVEYIFSNNPLDYISETVTGEPAPQQIEVWRYESKSSDNPQGSDAGSKIGVTLLYFFNDTLYRTRWLAENESANDT